MLITQMASFYKKQGRTLADRIQELYAEFGTYSHELLNFEFSGADGAQKMQELMKDLRKNQPQRFAERKVGKDIDYFTQKEFDLPKANMLQYDLEEGAQVIIRPSGTEPQIKVYLTVSGSPLENEKTLRSLRLQLENMVRR